MSERKSLFNEDERYTNEGTNLQQEASFVMGIMMSKWIDKGYSTRDVECICREVIEDISLSKRM